jgi:hypothetical protein
LANGKVYTHVIAKIIWLCDFPMDSIMLRSIEQQGLEELEDIAIIGVDEVNDFFTVDSDGFFEAKPMQVHLRKFKAFLLYFKRKGQELLTTLKEDDILDMKKTEFKKYCGSAEYLADIATFDYPVVTKTNPRIDGIPHDFIHSADLLTVQEFQQNSKCGKHLYSDLEDNKDFIKLDHHFGTTAQTHHTDYVLDKSHGSIWKIDIDSFKDGQTFTYDVVQDPLKTENESY